MSEDTIASNLKIRQRSIFAMDELYKNMFRWFSRNNYDFQEKEYFEQIMPGGDAKKLEIAWIARRKISDYIRFVIEVKFLVAGLKSTEIEQDGVKRKIDSGDVEMRFTAKLERDYDKKWESNPVTQFLRDFYDKKIVRSRMEGYEVQLHEEIYALLSEIKAFLNLYKFQDIES